MDWLVASGACGRAGTRTAVWLQDRNRSRCVGEAIMRDKHLMRTSWQCNTAILGTPDELKIPRSIPPAVLSLSLDRALAFYWTAVSEPSRVAVGVRSKRKP